ncbi:hypothetical protein PR048_030945 [Dryococelus australis]|uniref:Integrase zinc-binding domain-containing protein n=1 Tax=Dryococelus australis TaxID=614101 RepID=A0ABQ9GE55_9NEOP|nr:hypothetical protein PR048_030945 [Dryococelus australis]
MSAHVRQIVRECIRCSQYKSRHTNSKQQQQPRLPTEPFEMVVLDLHTMMGKRFIVISLPIGLKHIQCRAHEPGQWRRRLKTNFSPAGGTPDTVDRQWESIHQKSVERI